MGDAGGRPSLRETFQHGSGKLRVGRSGEVLVLNTSGGLAGGDLFETRFSAEAHTLTVSTVACERVYRCEEGPGVVRQALRVAPGARLLSVPQPTLVFDGGRLDRRTTVEVAGDGRFTLCEGLVLGREARGEAVRDTALQDRIEVRLDGRLAFVDALRLDGAALPRLSGPAGLGGARGIGLVLHREADLAGAVERARAVPVAGRAGASAVNGVAVVRLLAPSHTALQDGLARIVEALSGTAPPRSWHL